MPVEALIPRWPIRNSPRYTQPTLARRDTALSRQVIYPSPASTPTMAPPPIDVTRTSQFPDGHSSAHVHNPKGSRRTIGRFAEYPNAFDSPSGRCSIDSGSSLIQRPASGSYARYRVNSRFDAVCAKCPVYPAVLTFEPDVVVRRPQGSYEYRARSAADESVTSSILPR